jgi:membrane protease YdiL (CAAX protease family)
MTLSALTSYVVYAAPTGVFSWRAVGAIAALAAALSFYYVVLPRRPVFDLLFLAFVAAVFISPLFTMLYPAPMRRLPADALGRFLLWTRLAILEALSIAGMRVHGFGLLPTRKEWRAGGVNFLLFLPAGAALGWALGFLHAPRPAPWWQTAALAVATLLGMLWVVALRDEFFFRGLLQPWLAGWLRNPWAGLVAASLPFGAAHLSFGRFPNWRFALLAAVAGLFYGRAYLRAGSVRAAMVTHALVNTAWRVFLS